MKRRNEQRALAALQVLILVVAIGSLVFFLTKGKKGGNEEKEQASNTALIEAQGEGRGGEGKNAAPSSGNAADAHGATAQNIIFDPNTADSVTLVRVGFSPFQAGNILKYRRKGGQYHRPEDVKRVYGLTVGQWEHLAPLISIGKEYQYLSDNEDVYANSYSRTHASGYKTDYPTSTASTTHPQGAGNDQMQNGTTRTEATREDGSPFRSNNRIQKLRSGEHIDLGNADTTALQKIPGIGSYYAKRIAEYGQRLGGFASLSQLNDKELDFLPVGIEQYITLNSPHIKKMRINRMQVRELNHHPYISYPQAKQISERVRLYGPIQSWNDLLFLSEFTERDKARLEPYISFE